MTKGSGIAGLTALILALTSLGAGAAIVNAPAPITHLVTVNPIVVANDDGSNQATYLGDATEQADIEVLIDSIWAQAGIDVAFLAPQFYNDTFANEGTSAPAARPSSDLDIIVADAEVAGITHADPNVINVFFVMVSAGHPPRGPNHAAGLGFVDGNGLTQYVGANLLTFDAGRDVIAGVLAHEIGHNLGLEHIVEGENLMQVSTATPAGERLNATQIAVALASPFSVEIAAVPLPAGIWLLAGGCVLLGTWRRRTASAVRTIA